MNSSMTAIVQYDEAARFGSLVGNAGKVEKGRVGGERRRRVEERCCQGPGALARRAMQDATEEGLADGRTTLRRRRNPACICYCGPILEWREREREKERRLRVVV